MSQITRYIIILNELGTLFGIGFGDQNDHINGFASPQPLLQNCHLNANVRQYIERAPTTKDTATKGCTSTVSPPVDQTPLPGVILGNVRWIRSKMDEVHANTNFLTEYCTATLMCFSDDTIDRPHLYLGSFVSPNKDYRSDASERQMKGGLCSFINQRWCNNNSVKWIICMPDIEHFSIYCRPFYLPREISTIFLLCSWMCLPTQIKP